MAPGNFAKSRLTLAFLLFGLVASSVPIAQAQAHQVIRLTSGKQIKLIGIFPVAAEGGGPPRTLSLKYETERPIADKKELSAEVDDVWDMFKVELDKHGVNQAIISACSQPLGGDKYNQQYDFVLVKENTGRWQCINNDVVGVGTAAKVAYREGLKLSKQGRSAEAINMFDKCLAMDPIYAPAYIDRAAANLAINRPDKAVADADQALKLVPDNTGVYCNRGIAHWKLNERQKALEDFGKAISINPNDPLGYMNRGAALVEVGKYPEAIADLTKAIQLDPKAARPFHNRAVAFQKLAEMDKQQATELGYQGAVQTASVGQPH